MFTFGFDSGFDKDPRTSKFGLHMQVPFDQIVGKYEMNGKLLLISVRGAGKGKMAFSKSERVEVKEHSQTALSLFVLRVQPIWR